VQLVRNGRSVYQKSSGCANLVVLLPFYGSCCCQLESATVKGSWSWPLSRSERILTVNCPPRGTGSGSLHASRLLALSV